MRWDAQGLDVVDGAALPGMGNIRGLVRSVQVPEFPGTTLHEVRSRSALNKVPEGSGMPFGWTINPYRGCAHACVYCLAGDTRILMADGRQRALAELEVGDDIVGTERRGTYRHFVRTRVLAHWRTVKPAYRVRLADGTELIASGDHRFLSTRGWKHVTGATSGRDRRPHLTTNDELLGLGRSAETPAACPDYNRGFPFSPATDTRRAVAAIRTSAAAAVARISEVVDWPAAPTAAWHRGFLAGIFDAEGSRSAHVLRITNSDPEILDRTRTALRALGFDALLEDRHLPNGVCTVRVRGGMSEQMRFVHLVDPAIRRKCGVTGQAVKTRAALRVVSVEPLGTEMPMFDITTGTGDFVANGVISHNCFARGTHQWLELDSGRDFDTQIVVKTNLVDVLRRELARPSWRREHVALGTNTDPYQRAEGRYRLMPGVISALAGSGTPFSVLTKGTLARRDVPLLAAAARDVPLGLGVSLAIWDDALHTALEPGVPSPRARLELVRTLAEAGLPCGVFLAPVLPGLTDDEESLDAAVGAIAAAGATGVTVLALHLRPGAREWFLGWLTREHPELVPHYRRLYGHGAYVPATYRTALAQRVAPILAAHGLDRQAGGRARGADRAADAVRGLPGDTEGAFPLGSLPARNERSAPRAGGRPAGDEGPEQLTLL